MGGTDTRSEERMQLISVSLAVKVNTDKVSPSLGLGIPLAAPPLQCHPKSIRTGKEE